MEATAIAYEQQGVKPARPLTHDLLRDILAALKAPLQAVEIMELKENIFYADLLIGDGVRVSARPSDSIALALRVGAPIRCAEQVLDRGRHRHPGRAGGRGREVPRVPRAGPPGGLRGLSRRHGRSVAIDGHDGPVVRRTRRVAALPPRFAACAAGIRS